MNLAILDKRHTARQTLTIAASNEIDVNPDKHAQSPETGDPSWVETPTARMIISAAEMTRNTPTIGVIYGDSGTGKTTALRYAAKAMPNTYMISAGAGVTTPTKLLYELVREMGVSGYVQRAHDLFERAMSRMSRQWNFDRGLLIIDEAQHLKKETFDSLRAFFDEGDIAVIFSGNDTVYAKTAPTASVLPQVSSRVGVRLKIGAPRKEDVGMILDAHGIAGKQERDYCHRIADMSGRLRALDTVIRHARNYAQECDASSNTRITLAHLQAAANIVGINLR